MDLTEKIKYVEADKVIPYANNPKKHPPEQVDKIAASIKKFGFTVPLLVTGDMEIIAGHGRIEAARKLDLQKVPVIVRDDLSYAEVKALRIADNRLTESKWDEELLPIEFKELADMEIDLDYTGFTEEEIDAWLSAEDADAANEEIDAVDVGNMSRRETPIDLILTIVTNPLCCIAVDAGWLVGMQSSSSPACPMIEKSDKHAIQFIDNDYFNYNHEKHLQVVAEHKPKYATVRDIMTKKQCRDDDIEFYSFEQIMDWAEELEEHAENVIVIPKYDCIDDIPERFILGFSIPTSHGGTPVNPERFRGRDIHLLGGGWSKQLRHLEYFGEDVVSLDNNYINKMIKFGKLRLFDSTSATVGDFFPYVSNPRMVALAVSLGNMAANVQELYSDEPLTPHKQSNE